jgi:myo-inositol catabolism protein IolC
MVEVFARSSEPDALARAVAIVSGLGTTSAFTWLKLPVVPDMARVLSATTLPTVLLGGDPAPETSLVEGWASAMSAPQVRGLVVGRTLLYPPDGDVARAVDAAAAIVRRRVPAGTAG